MEFQYATRTMKQMADDKAEQSTAGRKMCVCFSYMKKAKDTAKVAAAPMGGLGAMAAEAKQAWGDNDPVVPVVEESPAQDGDVENK